MICSGISSCGWGVRRKWLSALAIGFVFAYSASASTIQLGINGNAQVGQNFINFGRFPTGDPYNPAPGVGTFAVSMVGQGIFESSGVKTGQIGFIRSLAVGQSTVQPFMSVQGSIARVDLYLLQLAQGTVGPFTLTDTPNGAIVYMNFAGVVSAPGDLENFTGTFSATFNGWTAAALLAEEATGTAVTTPFSATFSAVTRATPEPATLIFLGVGLLLVGLISRRKDRPSGK